MERGDTISSAKVARLQALLTEYSQDKEQTNSSFSEGGVASFDDIANVGATKVKHLGKTFGKTLNSAFKGTEKVWQTAAAKVHKPGGGSKGSASADAYQNDWNDENANLQPHTQPSTSMDSSDDWCEEHFLKGCHCKRKSTNTASSTTTSNTITSTSLPTHESNVLNHVPKPSGTSSLEEAPRFVPPSTPVPRNTTTLPTPASLNNKPCFQRPINPKSNLIANGWIEQQRRSKMRVVWKDILASLVEGRKPNEETTLWIQRQVTNAITMNQELEALHQIPMKWIDEVRYVDFYGDFRFSIKIHNVPDEFLFRTRDAESAMNWVITLKTAVENSTSAVGSSSSAPVTSVDDPDDRPTSSGSAPLVQNPSAGSEETSRSRMSIKELRMIAETAGYNTRGMERSDLERIASRLQAGNGVGGAVGGVGATAQQRAKPEFESNRFSSSIPFDELRAEAELEEERRRQAEYAERQAAERQAAERRRQQELAARQAAERQRQQQEAERQRQQQAAAAAAEADRVRLLKHQEEMRLKQQEEMRRQQEEMRLKQQEEMRRQQEMAARQQEMAARQAAERQRQQEAERQRQAEAERARQAEAERQRQQQEFAARQAAAERQRQQQQQWQHQQQQQQPNFFNQQQPFQNGAPPPPNSGQQHPLSPLKDKYKVVDDNNSNSNRSEEVDQVAITRVKRNILISWALQPPKLNTLRPIEQLVLNIHTVFPPAFGVAAHSHFTKWKPFTVDEVCLSAAMRNAPDENKLKKAVRKIRFFLHPDRLPKDLNAEQAFLCRMVWDVVNDSYEEYLASKDDLGWVHN